MGSRCLRQGVARSPLTPHAARVSPDWVVASSPPPPPPQSAPPSRGPIWGPAEHSGSGLHCSPRLISGSDSGWRRAPQSGRPGRAGGRGGRDPRRIAAVAAGLQHPARSLGVRWPRGQSRCALGGARAVSAGSPAGGWGAGSGPGPPAQKAEAHRRRQ